MLNYEQIQTEFMKQHTIRLLVGLVALVLASAQTRAQMLSPNQAGLNAAMLKLFGNTTAFTSKSQVQMLEKADKETLRLPLDFALLHGQIRLGSYQAKIKSNDFTPEMTGPLQRINMT